jgi:4-hydroxymandelate oxidase
MLERDVLARRRFLQFLAASPLLAGYIPLAQAYPRYADPQTIKQVLNIAHLDKVAQRVLDRDAYHFIVGAADDGSTMLANNEAYPKIRIRPRRLVDVSEIDTSVTLFGRKYSSPIILAPVGNQKKINPGGELATARAAAKRKHLMICSMMTNHSFSEIAAVGADNWLQLYPSPNRDFMKKLIQDAEATDCDTIVLTIDGPGRGNHEAARWFALTRDRSVAAPQVRLGNFEKFKGPKAIGSPSLTWDDLAWYRDNTSLNLVLKGVVTHEDARLCKKYGMDGVVVSNHGGRQEGNGRATLEVLPEVVDALKGRMPVLLDGGIRRGADAYKAIALGADAVCIGRPYLWGLGAFGQDGVDKCLAILQTELIRTMRYAGTPKLDDITPAHVWTSS